jgi:broad specificity phosphatase PhoE
MDAPLNEIGFLQAAQLADYICKSYHIDAVYTSDLSRAVETVRPTAERLGLELHLDPALRELDTGKWTGVPYGEVRERYAADFAAYGQSIDAPCTGSGTLRRHPEISWRLVPADIGSLAALQLELLRAAAVRVAAGGTLIYATCSVLRVEDEDVVEAFLASEEGAPFVWVDPEAPGVPAIGGPDGHFCARLKRRDT